MPGALPHLLTDGSSAYAVGHGHHICPPTTWT